MNARAASPGPAAAAISDGTPGGAVVAPQRRWLAWLIAVVVTPLAFLALLMLVDRPPSLADDLRVRRAWQLLDAGDRVPARADRRWTPIEVPRVEPPTTGSALQSSWYAIEPTLAQRSHERLAIYVPEPSGNLLVYVNGVKVADGGPVRYPATHHVFPLLFQLPERALAQPDAQLLLRVVRDGVSRRLPELYLGPAAMLEPVHARWWWVQAGSVRVVMLVASSLCLLALSFFLLRPADRAYGWFAAALGFWIAHIVRDHLVELPVPRPLWTALTNVALAAFVCCAIVFVHRFVGVRRPTFERAAAAVVAGGGVVVVLLAWRWGWTYNALVGRTWVPLINAGGLYLVWQLVRAARAQPSVDRFALLAAAAATSLIGLRDFVYDIDLLPIGSMFYLGYALALVVCVFGAIVVRRFARAVTETERLNRELERRVADKSRELEANHARVRALEQEQARRRERERIMREVHDGIGGQLVQGLAVAERGGDRTVLREVFETCLADLRMMVDAVDAGDADVLNLLARFRHRIGRRLDAAGVELEWRVSDLSPSTLRAGEGVHVLRILQEAFANALRHSGGTRITVVTGSERDGSVWIEVRDDGSGLQEGSQGHGLDGMRARAAQLGGELRIDSSASGCTIRLRLPRSA
jgi:signal transduction histidine kinase